MPVAEPALGPQALTSPFSALDAFLSSSQAMSGTQGTSRGRTPPSM